MFAARLPHPSLAPRPQQSLPLPMASVPKGIARHGDTVGRLSSLRPLPLQPPRAQQPVTWKSGRRELAVGRKGRKCPLGPSAWEERDAACAGVGRPLAETVGLLHPRTAHSRVEDVPRSSRSQCGFTAEPPTQAATALLAQRHGQPHSFLPPVLKVLLEPAPALPASHGIVPRRAPGQSRRMRPA